MSLPVTVADTRPPREPLAAHLRRLYVDPQFKVRNAIWVGFVTIVAIDLFLSIFFMTLYGVRAAQYMSADGSPFEQKTIISANKTMGVDGDDSADFFGRSLTPSAVKRGQELDHWTNYNFRSSGDLRSARHFSPKIDSSIPYEEWILKYQPRNCFQWFGPDPEYRPGVTPSDPAKRVPKPYYPNPQCYNVDWGEEVYALIRDDFLQIDTIVLTTLFFIDFWNVLPSIVLLWLLLDEAIWGPGFIVLWIFTIMRVILTIVRYIDTSSSFESRYDPFFWILAILAFIEFWFFIPIASRAMYLVIRLKGRFNYLEWDRSNDPWPCRQMRPRRDSDAGSDIPSEVISQRDMEMQPILAKGRPESSEMRARSRQQPSPSKSRSRGIENV